MTKKKCEFIWSDNWYIEDSKAWFVDGELDILFCLNIISNQCEYIAKLPNTDPDKFRLNPRCIKIENNIFCMPDKGGSIWVYNLKKLSFQEIKINNPNNKRISVIAAWKYEGKLYALSCGLNQMIEINMNEKKIENYYSIFDTQEMEITSGIKVGTMIYCISASSNQIFEFNLKSKVTTIYTIENVKDYFYTISYDGEKFWLSGYSKKIYIWNRESDSVKILGNIPKRFGIYDFFNDRGCLIDFKSERYNTPAFIESRAVGQYIWFIPFRTNLIIYVDKITYQIFVLNIEGENETRYSLLLNNMKHKYLVEYVLNNRYMGIFSLKNKCILEIDAKNKKVEKKSYFLNDEYLNIIAPSNKIFFVEGNNYDQLCFKRWLSTNKKSTDLVCDKKYGREIYNQGKKNLEN